MITIDIITEKEIMKLMSNLFIYPFKYVLNL